MSSRDEAGARHVESGIHVTVSEALRDKLLDQGFVATRNLGAHEEAQIDELLARRSRAIAERNLAAHEMAWIDAILAELESSGRAKAVNFERLAQAINGAVPEARREMNPFPKYSEVLLLLVVPRGQEEAIAGDFEERFKSNMKLRGYQRAVWRYRVEALKTALPLIWPKLKTKLKSLGLFGFLATIFKHFVG